MEQEKVINSSLAVVPPPAHPPDANGTGPWTTDPSSSEVPLPRSQALPMGPRPPSDAPSARPPMEPIPPSDAPSASPPVGEMLVAVVCVPSTDQAPPLCTMEPALPAVNSTPPANNPSAPISLPNLGNIPPRETINIPDWISVPAPNPNIIPPPKPKIAPNESVLMSPPINLNIPPTSVVMSPPINPNIPPTSVVMSPPINPNIPPTSVLMCPPINPNIPPTSVVMNPPINFNVPITNPITTSNSKISKCNFVSNKEPTSTKNPISTPNTREIFSTSSLIYVHTIPSPNSPNTEKIQVMTVKPLIFLDVLKTESKITLNPILPTPPQNTPNITGIPPSIRNTEKNPPSKNVTTRALKKKSRPNVSKEKIPPSRTVRNPTIKKTPRPIFPKEKNPPTKTVTDPTMKKNFPPTEESNPPARPSNKEAIPPPCIIRRKPLLLEDRRPTVSLSECSLLTVGSAQFRCRVCPFSTSQGPHLREHCDTLHDLALKAWSPYVLWYHQCALCPESTDRTQLFPTIEHLQNHYQAEHTPAQALQLQRDLCHEIVRNLALLARTNNSDFRFWKCFLCLKKMNTCDGLINHISAVHYDIRKYYCTLCPFLGASVNALYNHTQASHGMVEKTSLVKELVEILQGQTNCDSRVRYVRVGHVHGPAELGRVEVFDVQEPGVNVLDMCTLIVHCASPELRISDWKTHAENILREFSTNVHTCKLHADNVKNAPCDVHNTCGKSDVQHIQAPSTLDVPASSTPDVRNAHSRVPHVPVAPDVRNVHSHNPDVHSHASDVPNVHSRAPDVPNVHSRVPDVPNVHLHTPDVSDVPSHTPDVSEVQSHTPDVHNVHSHASEVHNVHSHAPDVPNVHSHTRDVQNVHAHTPNVSKEHSHAPKVSSPHDNSPLPDPTDLKRRASCLKAALARILSTPLQSSQYSCFLCPQHFPSRGLLKNHVLNLHFRVKRIFCIFCDFSTFLRDSMTHHFTFKHGNKDAKFLYINDISEAIALHVKYPVVSCQLLSSIGVKSLTVEPSTEPLSTGKPLELCNQHVKNPNPLRCELVITFTCRFCKVKFDHESELRTHLNSVTCHGCEKLPCSLQDFSLHALSRHNHVCHGGVEGEFEIGPPCGVQVTSPRHLLEHLTTCQGVAPRCAHQGCTYQPIHPNLTASPGDLCLALWEFETVRNIVHRISKLQPKLGELRCYECSRNFPTENLLIHTFVVHYGMLKLKCTCCTFSDLGDVKTYSTFFKDKKFFCVFCKFCKEKFYTEAILHRHYADVHPNLGNQHKIVPSIVSKNYEEIPILKDSERDKDVQLVEQVNQTIVVSKNYEKIPTFEDGEKDKNVQMVGKQHEKVDQKNVTPVKRKIKGVAGFSEILEAKFEDIEASFDPEEGTMIKSEPLWQLSSEIKEEPTELMDPEFTLNSPEMSPPSKRRRVTSRPYPHSLPPVPGGCLPCSVQL